jgi:predicted Zn-dependent protease
MNKTQEAAKAYESAITLKPDYRDAQMNLAELYYVVKEHTKSIDLLNVLIAEDPTDATFYCLKGDNQRELKDTLRAIATYQKALELDGEYYDAAMQLGLLLAAKKKINQQRNILPQLSASTRAVPRRTSVVLIITRLPENFRKHCLITAK